MTLELDKNQSYSIGFILGDGHVRKVGNYIRIVIQKRDGPILQLIGDSLAELVTDYEYTLFSGVQSGYTETFDYAGITIKSQQLIELFSEIGIPRGEKSKIIKPPNCRFDHYSLVRGYTDADGSLGLTGTGIPFISWVVSSEIFKDYFLAFIKSEVDFDKKTSRNKRFGVYNIALVRIKAQTVIQRLYLMDDGISLERKKQKAIEAMSWTWHARKPPDNAWSEEEDNIIRTVSVEEAKAILGRSTPAIYNRRYNLKKGGIHANS